MSLYSVLKAATENLAAVLAAVDINGQPIKVYAYDPGIPDTFPCALISLPDVERTSVLDGESELGSNDVWITWTTNVYLDPSDPFYANVRGIEIISDFVDAVDENYTLGHVVEDTRIERTDGGFISLSDSKRLMEIQMVIRAAARY